MLTTKTKKHLTLSVADLQRLAGSSLASPTVDRSGVDDSNTVTLSTADAVLTFSKPDLLEAIRAATPGALPTGDPRTERHEDGRPHDSVDAAISIDRSGKDDSDAVTLRWAE